jgi:serine/threonine protein phosphatase PrpC
VGINIVEESGSTANIILIDEKKVYCANLGDSRSVCIYNKKFAAMSFDHKPDDREEKLRIQNANVNYLLHKNAKGFVVDGRVCGSLSLSRAFGDF